MDVDDDASVVQRETSFAVKLCLQKGPTLVCGGEKPPLSKFIEVGSKRKKLLSFMISMRKKPRCSVEAAEKWGSESWNYSGGSRVVRMEEDSDK